MFHDDSLASRDTGHSGHEPQVVVKILEMLNHFGERVSIAYCPRRRIEYASDSLLLFPRKERAQHSSGKNTALRTIIVYHKSLRRQGRFPTCLQAIAVPHIVSSLESPTTHFSVACSRVCCSGSSRICPSVRLQALPQGGKAQFLTVELGLHDLVIPVERRKAV